MKSLTVIAMVLAFAARKPKPPAEPADPNAPVAKAHAGKIWVRAEAFPASEGSKLAAWLTAEKPASTVTAKAKDAPWSINYLAVFKKPALKGPMTVQFFEKGDLKNWVDQYSAPNAAATLVFQATYDLSPDQGFNKNHTYAIRVGQIIAGKFDAYASGEVTLK
jgi:hypothetical protein